MFASAYTYFPHAPGLDWPAIVADPARELCITEGELKAAAASLAGFPTVGLSGVDCFGSRRAGVGFLPELAAINYSGRKVVVAYDSDITDKPEVQQALKRLAIQLAARGALVHVVTLPPGPDGAKVGLDDFLLAHTAADLRALLDAAGLYVSELDQIVGRFNERYMVVKDGGRALVFEDVLDERRGHRKFDPMKFQDLENLYANTRVQVGAYQNGAPIFKTHAEAWLAHPLRRQFIRGVVFDPTGAERDGVLNLWRGFAVAPAPGDWSRLRWHIRNVICNGDAARSDYLLGWLARLVQHPAEPGQVAVVMRGGEGVGKGTLAKALQRLIGHHALAVSNAKHLVGNFNAHLRDCVFLFADEAFFAGDKAHVSVLKTLITEDQIAIEGKGRDVVHAPNFLHLMMASNEEWVVPASLDSRRFFMLDVPSTKKGDHAHFNAIWEQLESGGLAAMLHDLLAMDLSLFDVRAVPVTDALQEQRKLSMPTAEAWWAEVLARGYVFQSEHGNDRTFREWREQASTELLFASYQTFAKGHGERHPMSRETLGKFLAKVAVPGAKSFRPWR